MNSKKLKNINLSVLNIKLHPHTQKRYIQLMKEAFECKKSIKIRGQYYGLPMELIQIDKKRGFILGKFYRYTEIDKTKPWLDLSKASLLLDDDGNPIPQVDDYTKPNSTEIYFVFLIKNHRLVFENDKISPNSIRDFLYNLFMETKFTEISQNEITVDIEYSHESIEEILKMYKINNLTLKINKPNPDDFDSMEEEIQELLNNVHADEYTEEYKTKDGNITPDEILKQKMYVAKSNGVVNAKGRNRNGKVITESTEDHPLIEKLEYNTETTTFLDALISSSTVVVNKIMERLRNVS